MKDSTGRYLTRALFVELADPELMEKYPPKFTLEEAREIYLECEDPTEYEAAKVLLGSWDHWQALLKNPTVLIHIQKWREELEIRLRSQAVKNIQFLALGEKGFAAAKWLAERGWEPKKAGRPTKKEVERETRAQAGIDDDISKDAARVVNIRGGK
jgi:hypothetical protein